MKLNFRFGKRSGEDRLTPEHREVIDRLERGEIDADEAAKLLSATVRTTTIRLGDETEVRQETSSPPKPPTDSADDARARELVERLAREIYGDETT
jgi:hypothetical protein